MSSSGKKVEYAMWQQDLNEPFESGKYGGYLDMIKVTNHVPRKSHPTEAPAYVMQVNLFKSQIF